MSLTGSQYQQLVDALRAAFDEGGLRRMVKFELDEDFDHITSPGNLNDRVYELVAWADREGKVVALMDGAVHSNPGNATLRTSASDAKTWHLAPPAKPLLPPADPELPPVPTPSLSQPVVTAPQQTAGPLPPNRKPSKWVGDMASAFVVAVLAGVVLLFIQFRTPWFSSDDDRLTPTPANRDIETVTVARGETKRVVVGGVAAVVSVPTDPNPYSAIQTPADLPVLVIANRDEGKGNLKRGECVQAGDVKVTLMDITPAPNVTGVFAVTGVPSDHTGTSCVNETLPVATSTVAVTAKPTVDIAVQHRLEAERLLRAADTATAALDADYALVNLKAAAVAVPAVVPNLTQQISDTLRVVATGLVQQGEQILRATGAHSQTERIPVAIAIKPEFLAWAATTVSHTVEFTSTLPPIRQQALISATALFSQALALNPPPDSLLYVWIEPGTFLMGASDTDPQALPVEKPLHQVTVPGYWIRRTEVTNAQYNACVKEGPCTPPMPSKDRLPRDDDQHPSEFDPNRWTLPDVALRPVVNVDWQQASVYAQWVGGRLPSEAEWERACRNSHGGIYPWGNAAPTTELLRFGVTPPQVFDVASYPSGVYGLYDMIGNVWELAADPYIRDRYQNSPEDNADLAAGTNTVTLRGGGVLTNIAALRCSYRTGWPATKNDTMTGFRVVAP